MFKLNLWLRFWQSKRLNDCYIIVYMFMIKAKFNIFYGNDPNVKKKEMKDKKCLW